MGSLKLYFGDSAAASVERFFPESECLVSSK